MLVAKADAPAADAVPWLFGGCDQAHDSAEQRVDYTATYYFFAP